MTEEFEYYPLNAELVGLFNKMEDGEYEALKTDIEENGLIEPITVWMGTPGDTETFTVIDGRHRIAICEELCIKPKYDYMTFDDPEAAAAFVKSKNEMRRANTMPVTRAEKQAAILKELETNKDRADNVIAKKIGVDPKTVKSVRAKHGLQSDNKVGSDGRSFSDKPVEEEEANGNFPFAPSQTPLDIAPPEKTVKDEKFYCAKTIATQLYPKLSDYQINKYAKILKKIIATPFGAAMAERYGGWEAPAQMNKFLLAGEVDLRFGWENIGYSEALVSKFTIKNKAKNKEFYAKIDELDALNAKKQQIAYDATQPRKPKVFKNNADGSHPRGDHPKIMWYGDEIDWWTIEGMTFIKAHCVIQVFAHVYTEVWWLYKDHPEAPWGEVSATNFARSMRHMGDYMEGVGGKGARAIFDKMEDSMDQHPELYDVHQSVEHQKYFTHQ